MAGAIVGTSCLPDLVSDFDLDDDSARVLVSFPATEADTVAAGLAAVEGATAGLPGLQRIRSVGCATGGAVLLHIDDDQSADHAGAVHAAIAAGARLPPGSGPARVQAVADDLLLLSVRGDDVFAARDWVDDVLAPALSAVPGVYEVKAVGGATEPQLRLDPERMLATDLSVQEVLAAVKAASNLDKAEVKRLPGNVTIFLRDVARLEDAPAGERLRRDGGIEVRVRGHSSAVGAATKAVRALTPPATLQLATLDGHSVETVTVLVSRRGRGGAPEEPGAAKAASSAVDAVFADVAAAALSVPGVHTFRRGRALQLTIDRHRLTARGLASHEAAMVGDVAAAATTGLMVKTARGPLKVVFGAESTPEALLQTRLFTTASGQPVRLFDVARATLVEEQRRERIELHEARRLRLSFDAGVRQRALPELEARLAAIRSARPGVQVVVERDGDTAPLDVVCP